METEKDEMEIITENSSNPTLENDIDPADNEKMRGDAIGDTMYSERFVLTTLLQLMEDEWNEELESDLCSVWDMTAEKDVALFLLEKNFIELASEIIPRTKEFRLIEILVGILGNMCILPEVCEHFFAVKDSRIVFSLINVTDSPTLIQLMRMYKALLFNNINYNEIITDEVIDRVHFILRSSQNADLLLNTLQVSADIMSKKYLKLEQLGQFLDSANEAFKEMRSDDDEDLKLSGILTRTIEKNITAYLRVIENIRTILVEYDFEKYDEAIPEFGDESVRQAMHHVEVILNYCTNEELQYMRDSIEYFIYCSAYAVITFKAPFQYRIFRRFIHIFNFIVSNEVNAVTEVSSFLTEVIIYMVNSADIDALQRSLKKWSVSKLNSIFVENIINKQKSDDAFVKKVNALLNN